MTDNNTGFGDILTDMSSLIDGSSDGSNSNFIDIKKIVPNPNQPRKTIDKERIEQLASTIKKDGLLNPIIVRKKGSKFELIAGQRRILAFKFLKKTEIPTKIITASDKEAERICIIENGQDESVSDLESAISYNGYMDRHKIKNIRELSKEVGKPEKYLARILTLLTLPEIVKKAYDQGKIKSTQTAIELKKAYELSVDKTAEFIADNEEITYKLANDFYRSIRDIDKIDDTNSESANSESTNSESTNSESTGSIEEPEKDTSPKKASEDSSYKDDDKVKEVAYSEEKSLDYENPNAVHTLEIIKNLLGEDYSVESEAVAESLIFTIYEKEFSEIKMLLENFKDKDKLDLAKTIMTKYF